MKKQNSTLTPTSAPPAINHQLPNHQPPPPPRYSLRKGLAAWDLTFAGQRAVIKHEQGMYYVAYLLLNPPTTPIHALDLASRVSTLLLKNPALTELIDPNTGRLVPLDCSFHIQERSLGLDDVQTMRAVLRQQHELEAVLEDDQVAPQIKEEVQRELIDLYDYETKNTMSTATNAARCVRAVRAAIRRLIQRLASTTNQAALPHPVLRPFAAHLTQFLLAPSSQPISRAAKSGTALAGSFTYQPPKGITWSC